MIQHFCFQPRNSYDKQMFSIDITHQFLATSANGSLPVQTAGFEPPILGLFVKCYSTVHPLLAICRYVNGASALHIILDKRVACQSLLLITVDLPLIHRGGGCLMV
jgi:hypothetical protein